MEKNLEQNIRVEQYLNGEMSREEETAFELALKNDPALYEQYCFEIDLRDSLSDKEFKETFPGIDLHEIMLSERASALKKTLIEHEWEPVEKKMTRINSKDNLSENIERPMTQHAKIISNRRWVQIAVAASVIGLVVVLLWMTNKTTPPVANNEKKLPAKDSSNSIAKKPEIKLPERTAQWYADVANEFSERDKAPTEKPLPILAELTDFDNRKYQKIQALDADHPPVLMGDPNDKLNSLQNVQELAHYYKGLSYISTNDPKLAQKNLEWVMTNAKNEKLRIKAQWYLALIFVKNADPVNANRILDILVANKKAAPYNEKAAKLALRLK